MVYGGIDPAQLQALQQVTKSIKAQMRVDYVGNSLTLTLFTDDPAAKPAITNLLEQLSTQLSVQLNSFFGIQGEIIEKKA